MLKHLTYNLEFINKSKQYHLGTRKKVIKWKK